MGASPLNQGTRTIEGLRVPCGDQQITDLSSAVGLTIPDTGARFALIQAEAQDVRWRDSGSDPTASVGNILQENGIIEYNGVLSAIKFIETTSGAKLNVSYYK